MAIKSKVSIEEFREFGNGGAYISLFDARCLIICVCGVELGLNEMKKFLAQCDLSANSKCLNYDNICALVDMVSREYVIDAHEHCFSVFDSDRKGWINVNDFQRVLSDVSPLLAQKHGAEWFACADINLVGKVRMCKYIHSTQSTLFALVDLLTQIALPQYLNMISDN